MGIMKKLENIKNKIVFKLPVSRGLFLAHRYDFAKMLSAIKELEAINRAEIMSLRERLYSMEQNEIPDTYDEDDVMVG